MERKIGMCEIFGFGAYQAGKKKKAESGINKNEIQRRRLAILHEFGKLDGVIMSISPHKHINCFPV
jgi:hypothetical protein